MDADRQWMASMQGGHGGWGRGAKDAFRVRATTPSQIL